MADEETSTDDDHAADAANHAPDAASPAGAGDTAVGGVQAAGGAEDRARVTRTVDVPADAADVWPVVSDPAGRDAWLDDPDAAARTVRVDQVDAGRRLVWTWWRPDDDDPGASSVEIALRPLDGGGTRVVVTETLAVAVPVTTVTSPHGRSAPGTPRARATALRGTAGGDRWSRRLLGLELRFVAVPALVGA